MSGSCCIREFSPHDYYQTLDKINQESIIMFKRKVRLEVTDKDFESIIE